MRVSYDWLKSMVDVPADPRDLAAELIRTGTEVEAIEVVGERLDRVVTGQILSKEPHPDSDHMWLTRVDVGRWNLGEDGNPEPLQIVCGAQNFEANDHIVVALVGAELPGGVKIKKSKLRGQLSCGMNCSARELGIGSDQAGIMILPSDAPVGMPFAEYRGMSDTVLTCEITPNRPDCLSMIGMAREVGAVLDRDITVDLPELTEAVGDPVASQLAVEIEDERLCRRYVARVVRGITVGSSPEWLLRRLTALGMRPHNSIVDITNYVMMLTGQPLHSFDLNSFAERDGHRLVVVRPAHAGEHIQTLDGVDRELSFGMALITDGVHPKALAGVMGGADSEISDQTVDVLIESACFDAGLTSRTSRDLSLISDASIRFERQVDETGCRQAADIACALIQEIAGGEVAEGAVEIYPSPREIHPIHLRLTRVAAIVGAEIDAAAIEGILSRLGCMLNETSDGYTVLPPSFRPDLVREIDLIEEVLRIWGMDRVEPTLPAARNHIGGLTEEQHLLRRVGSILRACGLNEATSFSFAAPDDLKRARMTEVGRGKPVVLMNPLVAEQTELRRSLLPGLLQSVAYNRDHGAVGVLLYELGTLFRGRSGKSLPRELRSVAGVLSGAAAKDSWNQRHEPLRFFDAKGVVEELLAQLRIPRLRFREPGEGELEHLQPGRAAEVLSGGVSLGWVGEIHPAALEAFDIDEPVAGFELDLEQLIKLAQGHGRYQVLASYPSVEMDLAIVVDESVTYLDLAQRIQSAGGKLLEDVRLFDVYRDPKRVGEGKKSMAFSLTYRAADHTLTSEEVERAHERLVGKVLKAVGGEIRS
ncbi:phenylalanine--tRNA ligase subunit beta [Collinsella sp. AGMB00827]|uniref:Phenylalanine--tRNA ligase beta subunit n=1 Tax=Collinsella ureilytica TaxID=2869515 RepID=A0ABS7MIW9_9ACTN|nr:phenylalanine--tRNA ligase subunit beta [Collinsella urealyticum]MBY4797237.1 phenylalanine--tRNA ligase subunit beta [Collinsella urealyticum]